jgi:hypothetical protein
MVAPRLLARAIERKMGLWRLISQMVRAAAEIRKT